MTRPVPRRAGRTVSVLAAMVAVVAEGVAIAASPAGSARWNEAAVALVVLAYALVGLVIVWHRPGHPIGRLALAIAAVGASGRRSSPPRTRFWSSIRTRGSRPSGRPSDRSCEGCRGSPR